MDSSVSTRSLLLTRSVLGGKWAVILGGLSAAIAIGTSVLLGRIGAPTLGYYSAVLVTVNVIISVFCFGGENVIVYFLPRDSPDRKASFLATYVALIFLFAGLFYLLLSLSPPLMRALLGEASDAWTLWYVAILLPAVILHLIVVALLRAEMDIKGAVFGQSMVPLVTFVVFAGFAAIGSLQAREHVVIILTISGAYLISATYGTLRARRTVALRWRLDRAPYLPPGFWHFSLPLSLSTIIGFLFGHADQLIVLLVLGVTELGLYKAALVVAQVVPWFPMVLMRFAIYPTFTNLSARGDWELFERVYHKAITLAYLWSALVGVWLLLLAPYIMRLFGSQLAEVALLPAEILLAAALTTSPYGAVIGGYLLAQGRTTLLLGFTAAGAVLGLVLAYLGTVRYGVVGTALGQSISGVILVVACVIVLWRRFGLALPRGALMLPLLAWTAILAIWADLDLGMRVMSGLGLSGALTGFVIWFQLVGKEDVVWVLRTREILTATCAGLSQDRS